MFVSYQKAVVIGIFSTPLIRAIVQPSQPSQSNLQKPIDIQNTNVAQSTDHNGSNNPAKAASTRLLRRSEEVTDQGAEFSNAVEDINDIDEDRKQNIKPYGREFWPHGVTESNDNSIQKIEVHVGSHSHSSSTAKKERLHKHGIHGSANANLVVHENSGHKRKDHHGKEHHGSAKNHASKYADDQKERGESTSNSKDQKEQGEQNKRDEEKAAESRKEALKVEQNDDSFWGKLASLSEGVGILIAAVPNDPVLPGTNGQGDGQNNGDSSQGDGQNSAADRQEKASVDDFSSVIKSSADDEAASHTHTDGRSASSDGKIGGPSINLNHLSGKSGIVPNFIPKEVDMADSANAAIVGKDKPSDVT